MAAGAVVTCNIVIPAGVSSQVFYAQLMENGTPVGAVATNSNTIVLTNPALATGILNVQPSQFNLTDSYESQILTYTNTGNGPISALNISPASPLINGSTTCGSTLESGASCTYAVSFDGSQAIAGSSNVTASYNNGQTSKTAVSSLSYVGTNPESGLTITGTNSLIFTAKTATPSESTQITLTNIGNTNESNISFTIPTYFSLSAGSNNSCSLSGNAITDILTPANGIHNNCTLTLTYTNPSLSSSTESLVASYNYASQFNSGASANTSVVLSYSTVQSTAALTITPNPQDFSNIANNNQESTSHTFTVSNSSSDTAATIVIPTMTGAMPDYSVLLITAAAVAQ